MYGLICGGKHGVKNIFKILNSELETAMINGGFKDIHSFNNDRLIYNEKFLKKKL